MQSMSIGTKEFTYGDVIHSLLTLTQTVTLEPLLKYVPLIFLGELFEGYSSLKNAIPF